MSAGALKDAAVVEASAGLIAIKVDLTSRGGANQQVADRFHVSGIPAMVFLDPDGQEVARPTFEEMWVVETLAGRLREIAEQHRRDPFFWTMEEARRRAPEGANPRPIAVLRADRSELAREIEDLLLHADVRESAARFVWVREIVEPREGRELDPTIQVFSVTAEGTASCGDSEVRRRRGEVEIPVERLKETLDRLYRRWEARREDR